ncbi:MAG: ATP-binding protein [Deltaproteobacteria bacterium]|nr:ATP-binding protein [Deltaproteobacteria bacterium]
MKFVNRKDELESLYRFYKGEGFQFIPVYGRRRIGKTRLIQEFIKDKPVIYFLADSVAENEQLRNLGREVGIFFNDPFLAETGFKDWYQFFDYLKRHCKKRMLLVIDEFPYLVNSNKAISTIFQKGIDQYLKDTKIFLILMGSSIGMMEKEVLFYKAPLYGRRSGTLELREMGFASLKEFFPNKVTDELISIYGVTGAIPAYLEKLNPGKDIFRNVEELILDRGTFLYNEVEYLLREELREPRNYFVILRSIAQGKRKLSEIINDTGFEKSLLSRYLEILQSLRFIEKEVPVTEKYPEKSKLGLYKFHDRFFEFWFKYVFPNRGRLEIGKANEVLRMIKETFKQHLSFVFEDVCKEHCVELLRDGKIRFTSIGRWWHKNEEIDIVALNEENREIYFGEAKWSKKPVGLDIMEHLKKKATLVQWNTGKRKEYYMLFSRSGFTESLQERAIKEGVLLISL